MTDHFQREADRTEQLKAEYQAIRSRLVSALIYMDERDYETRRAVAEAKVNEFEAAYRAAMERLART